MSVALTAEQQAVFDAVERYIDDPCPVKPWFYYEGEAGTGKTVVMAALARTHPRAYFCAYTGKAASVLARKSGLPTDTVHGVIYQFLGEDKVTGNVYFGPKHEDGDLREKVAFVDESSMLSDYVMNDFLATGCKIIACGDPGQLPPVKGRAFFAGVEPDARLTTIHRQAWDSAIIRQSWGARRGHAYGDDGPDFRVVRAFSAAEAVEAGALLCWTNATRQTLNRLSRQWRGLGGRRAKAGEPVMALNRNRKKDGTLNGALYELVEDHTPGSGVLVIRNEYGEAVQLEDAWIEDFEDRPYAEETRDFAWGYAATVHKYQGSEAESVILVDEYTMPQWRREWLTTGITRAKQKIIVQRNW